MTYHIKTDKRKKKPFLIVRDEDGVVVGSSDKKSKAQRSIGYRNEALKSNKEVGIDEKVRKALKLRK